jgi:hypothetical protein
MGNVLTEDTVLTCAAKPTGPSPHGGTLTATGVDRLRVDGKKVLTGKAVTTGSITVCGNTNTNAGQVQCTKVTTASPGTATKLKVDGEPVVTDSLGGTTNGTPPGKVAASAPIHTRLRAD